jgi:hypothetical protein
LATTKINCRNGEKQQGGYSCEATAAMTDQQEQATDDAEGCDPNKLALLANVTRATRVPAVASQQIERFNRPY